MKNNISKLLISILFLGSCTESSIPGPDAGLKDALSQIQDIKVFSDIMLNAGSGVLNLSENKTLFIPTDEAFEHLDIVNKKDYDKATIIAFINSQMLDNILPSASFKSGKLTTSNTQTIRMYDGKAFTQIEDALIEKTDLKVGNLTVHLVDRVFKPITLTGHDHNSHASGHSHGGTHEHSMTNNCGNAGPSSAIISDVKNMRDLTSKFLLTLPTWDPNGTAPRTLPGGFALMGGRNNALPYVHYFSKQNMEDGKFMDPNAPEGLMCGQTADGKVYAISAVYLTREASPAQLHDLNCLYMFHEHDGLPGIMMHFFHNAYPSDVYGLDHEAEPIKVRSSKMK
jgi:hypothetical protein